MAQQSTEFTTPSATMLTELWYAQAEDTGLVQVFGNQSIPEIDTPPDDVVYRTLESDTEFGVPGVKAFAAIEVECLFYKEQFTTLKALADSGKELYWYVKLPDVTAGSGANAKPLVIKWKGAFRINIGEIALDDMIKTKLKIYKTEKPSIIEGLPAANPSA